MLRLAAVTRQEVPELSGLLCLFVIGPQMLFMCHFVFVITKLMQDDNNTPVCPRCQNTEDSTGRKTLPKLRLEAGSCSM